MSFTIQLTTDLVQVDPGATIPVTITIVSRSAEQDRFEMDIEGIDPEWKAVPVPVFTVEPNETHTERFFLKPHRSSESAAGDYPFVVRIRSLISAEAKTVQGVLKVKPFHHLSLEISPKKGFVSPFRKQNQFDVTVVNLGNTEHTVQFIASDPEDACTFEFEHEQVTVGPGQTRDVSFTANPVKQGLFSGSKLIGFSLTGRSTDAPAAVASAQAQLEQRPFFSLGTVALVVFLGVLYGLWLYTMPKPPKVEFSADARQINIGKPIHIKWSAQNASKILVFSLHDGTRDYIYEGSDAISEKEYTPKELGDYVIKVVASKDDRKVEESVSISVREPDKGPTPEILALTANPSKIKLGQPFILSYKFNENVKRAVLGPLNQDIVLSLSSIELTPTRSGSVTYTVAAYNENGVAVTKEVTVQVVDESDATILGFDASSLMITPDKGGITLSWQVTNAARVELKSSDGTTKQVDPTGSMDTNVAVKTTFILNAVDAKGRVAQRKLTVDVAKPAKGPDPTDPGQPPTLPPTNPPTTGGNR